MCWSEEVVQREMGSSRYMQLLQTRYDFQV